MLTNRKFLFGTTFLVGALALTSPVLAQTAPQTSTETRTQTQDPDAPETEDEVEAIVVTGSRIPRPEYEGVIPGVQVSEEDIEERLFTNAGDVLNDIPLVGGGASLNGTNGGQTASLGVTFIDLLNLGTARTLTLVNGRRFVSNNSATIFVSGNETGSQVDASSIPIALIDRVDILTVGGAAAYGADAVSGVVNYVMKDNYEGLEFTAIGGQTFEEQDADRYAFSGVAGGNFLDNRLNLAISAEYTKIDGILGADRAVRADNPAFLTNPLNGATRNPLFAPLGTEPVFISAALDGIRPGVPANRNRTNSTWFGGVIFNPVGSNGAAENATIANLPTGSALAIAAGQFQPNNTFRNPGFAQISPFGFTFINGGALPQVPSVPQGNCNFDATTGCTLAPSSIANLTVAQRNQIRTLYGVPTSTDAQLLAVIQSRRPTAREYYAANPATPINAFLGTFLPGLPDVATTGALAAFLPRTAVPLRFDRSGNVVTYDFAGRLATDPTAPGTFANSDGGDGQNRQDSAVLRVKQDRVVSNFIGNYDITDNVTVFTENLYAKSTVINPISTGGLFNGVTASTPENAGLLINVNHPFLTAANRTALANAGITNNFVLSRNNEDVVNDLSQESINTTYRSANGIRGNFSLLNREFGYELSHVYGRATTEVEFSAINDVAYALAIDAVNDGGTIRCRAQRDGLAAYVASYGSNNTPGSTTSNIPGAIPQATTVAGPGGLRQQVVLTPTITQALVDSCVPLNIFGEGRASQAARDYVSVRNRFDNESTQNFTQVVLTGELFDLPAGPLQFALSGELRKEELDYKSDQINIEGRTRSAPSAFTQAEVEAKEYGFELRIPIFGDDFQLPFVQSLDFNPAVRWTELEGEAAPYLGFATTPGGTPPTISPTYDGDRERIYTLAATWEVNDQLLFRGNISKSVRNPSIVELFLGGQPFFTAATDPCQRTLYTSGARGAQRRLNCIAEVRRVAAANGGILLGSTGTQFAITDDASAENFLTVAGGYAPSGSSFTGLISGRQTLVPEKGDSFTFGTVIRPDFIPNLIVAADYLEITVEDALGPLLATPAANFCYDSLVFPDNTAEIGVNSCGGIRRDQQFNFTNGFELPFFNLGATRVKAINANVSWSSDLSDILGNDRDWGRVGISGNAYYLLEYSTSGTGDFSDSSPSENTLGNPQLEANVSFLYRKGPFNARWNTNYTSESVVLAGTVQATFDQATVVRYPSFAVHTLSLGYDITDNASARLVIDNVTDEQELGTDGYYGGVYVDTIGRRWTAALTYKF